MLHDDFNELPEQRLTRELMRINAKLQRSDLAERSLVDLYEVLIHYDSEVDCEPQKLNDPASRFLELTHGSLEHRLSILAGMVQDTQSRLRSRVLTLTESLEAHDAARHAIVSYGGVVQREFATQTSPTLRYQS